MPRLLSLVGVVACGVLTVAVPSASFAAEPPNPKDPCSVAGRNTCGTLGVGFYKQYRYGIRWFGDFRGAVAGGRRGFCLDLRFWYAAPRYEYREAPVGLLRNRDAEVVPIERQQKIASAIWNYGRSENANQQAAVGLYVHSLMGDARAGEVDPAALNPAVVSLVEKIARDSSRRHGPYRVEMRFLDRLVVGKKTIATIRLLSAAGTPLPHVQLELAAHGAIGIRAAVETDGHGVARVPLTPAAAGELRLSVESAPVASTLPKIFRAIRGAAAANAQRLAVPSSQRVSASASAMVQAEPSVSSIVSNEIVQPGARVFNQIRVRGLGRTPAAIRVELYGPFASRSAIRCEGRPYWTRTVAVNGDGEVNSPRVKVAKAGFYSYRERMTGSPLVREATSDCLRAIATFLAAPRIRTGRGDIAAAARAVATGAFTPTRVRLPSARVNAAVSPVAIDLAQGALGVPANIRRAGWWKDGMAPGATSGTILISGHVDSSRAGPGAFFSLRRAKIGDQVQVTTASGRIFSYRVVSLRNYRKQALPTRLYSPKGPPRLVLVTCGGPFNPASGRYRDNVVLTAAPTGE